MHNTFLVKHCLTHSFTSVQQPLTDGLGHVERQPLALRTGAHHLAVDVALCG